MAIANDILDRAREALDNPNAPIGELAGVGLEISALANELAEMLEPLKARLREAGRAKMSTATGATTIRGVCPDTRAELGMVHVTFPKARVLLDPKVDLAALRRDLGSSFSMYFKERVVVEPVKDIRATIAMRMASNAPLVDKVMSAITYKTATPRVGFRPHTDILQVED
jgi:hypothetical protein